MIDVYVCEDVKEQRDVIVKYVEAAFMIHEYDMELRMSTDDPEDIISCLKTSGNTGLYFLDIDLKASKNGIILAKEIREYDPRGFIVFITSHSEMSYITFQYKVEALDFILKDNPYQLQDRISECIENVNSKYLKNARGTKKTITMKRGGKRITLEYDDILFFETSVNEHKLVVHTFDKAIEFFGKMKDIEDEVGEDFIRCHRAYLVNKNNIKEVLYAQKTIVMKNEATCSVSHRMLGHVRKQI